MEQSINVRSLLVFFLTRLLNDHLHEEDILYDQQIKFLLNGLSRQILFIQNNNPNIDFCYSNLLSETTEYSLSELLEHIKNLSEEFNTLVEYSHLPLFSEKTTLLFKNILKYFYETHKYK